MRSGRLLAALAGFLGERNGLLQRLNLCVIRWMPKHGRLTVSMLLVGPGPEIDAYQAALVVKPAGTNMEYHGCECH